MRPRLLFGLLPALFLPPAPAQIGGIERALKCESAFEDLKGEDVS